MYVLDISKMITGILSVINQYDNGAIVNIHANTSSTSWVYISQQNCNNCLHGDEVEVEILSESIEKQTLDMIRDYGNSEQIIGTGKVTKSKSKSKLSTGLIPGILSIKSTIIYGIGKKGGIYYIFKPSDSRYPNFIVLSRVDTSLYQRNLYAVIKLNQWLSSDKYPHGSCEFIIGEIGIIDNEIINRLYANGLSNHDWTRSLIKKKLINEEITKLQNIKAQTPRLDLTDKDIFSIDPPNCLDIDDALHIENIGDELYEIGIHIADVSEYIKSESVIDLYAKYRMTSLYWSQRTCHMIPSELSENLCSLVANQKRNTLSLLLKITSDGILKDYKFTETIICNKRKMTYDNAEILLEKKDKMLCQLEQILKIFRKCGDSNNIMNIHDNITPRAHFIVETCMITANELCAEFIIKNYDNGILRTHMDKKIDEQHKHINTDTTTSELLQYLYLRSQNAAQYQSFKPCGDNHSHFGLNAKYYTHFTSPIRRYVDLVNHRLIKNVLNSNKNNSDFSEEYFNKICLVANDINKKAKKLAKDITYLNIIDKLDKENKSLIQCEAFIVGIFDKTPSIKIKIYIPQFKLTTNIVICHYEMVNLYDIDRSVDHLKLIEKSTNEHFEYLLYSTIMVIITPIPNIECFTKKLRISLEM